MKERMSIKEVATLMGKSPQFVRVGLQRGAFPFGSAVKVTSRWSYHVSPKKFKEYLYGKEEPKNETIS